MCHMVTSSVTDQDIPLITLESNVLELNEQPDSVVYRQSMKQPIMQFIPIMNKIIKCFVLDANVYSGCIVNSPDNIINMTALFNINRCPKCSKNVFYMGNALLVLLSSIYFEG